MSIFDIFRRRYVYVQRRRARRRTSVEAWQRLDFSGAVSTEVLGTRFGIEVTDADTESSRAKIVRDEAGNATISVRVSSALTKAQRKQVLSRLVYKSICKALANTLERRVAGLNSAHFNSQVDRVVVKDSKTEWGHYSPSKSLIMLNFRLLYMPDDVIDFVIAHELAHTKVRNHQREFKDLLGSVVPDHRAKRKMLNASGWTYYKKKTVYEGATADATAAPDVQAMPDAQAVPNAQEAAAQSPT